MDINTTLHFYERIANDNLCLLYNGSFNDEITYKVIDLSEYNISNFNELSKMKKKVSFLMAECFQNIIRHREKPDERGKEFKDQGFFMTRNRGKEYFITSGNLIEDVSIDNLKIQLEKVNSLDKTELKALYMEALETPGFTSKGGAGLGLIEMARKSGQKLDYDFKPYQTQLSFFYNQVNLKSQDFENEHVDLPIDIAIDFHNTMIEKNILVLQKSDFSNDSILPVLNIIDKNLQGESMDMYPKKRIYHILVELLQNISRHCLKINGIREGIFMIGRTSNGFMINTGNFIKEEQKEPLQKQLELLNGLSEQGLVNLYMKTLKEGAENSVSGGAGIGLIDIARRSNGKLNYKFQSINGKCFFALSVTI